MTRLAQQPDLERDYAALKEQFNDKEMVDLSLAVATINSWNRMAVGFGRSVAHVVSRSSRRRAERP